MIFLIISFFIILSNNWLYEFNLYFFDVSPVHKLYQFQTVFINEYWGDVFHFSAHNFWYNLRSLVCECNNNHYVFLSVIQSIHFFVRYDSVHSLHYSIVLHHDFHSIHIGLARVFYHRIFS